MRIRALEAAEIPAIAEGLASLPLMIRYHREVGPLSRALGTALARGDGLLVADDSGLARGLAWFLTTGTLGMGGYLKLLAVFSGGEGKGTGAALLHAFEAETARLSSHAFLLASDFNEDAQRFYEREGYQRVGPLPALVLPDVVEVLFWKRLR